MGSPKTIFITGTSTSVGKTNIGVALVTALKDNGQYDNTLLIVTSDNGGLADRPPQSDDAPPYRGPRAEIARPASALQGSRPGDD